MTVLNVLVPLVSVLLGAGITYWLNVRARRRNRVEDLFVDAMAAVAVAEASKNYMRNVSWVGQSAEELSDFRAHLGRAAAENHVRRVAEAREALARVMPYRPELGPFYRGNPSAVYEQTDEILMLLRQGPAGSRGVAWRSLRLLRNRVAMRRERPSRLELTQGPTTSPGA